MGYQKPQQNEEKISTESFVNKTINNVLDFDMKVATGEVTNVGYESRFMWLVNSAEGACEGAGLIKTNNSFIDYEKLSEKEEAFLSAARELFKERYSKNPGTAAANIEVQARGALEEIVAGAYDAKKNSKKIELNELVKTNKMTLEDANLELSRYRLKLLIAAAEAKKTIRKEMNQ